MAEQLKKMALTLPYFVKTQEGQALIQDERVFCLAGKLYQGHKGAIIDVNFRQLQGEWDRVVDVDETLERVRAAARQRESVRNLRKSRELAEREQKAAERELATLQLGKLRKELGLEGGEANLERLEHLKSLIQKAEAPLPPEVPEDADIEIEPEPGKPKPVAEIVSKEQIEAMIRDAEKARPQVECSLCGAKSPKHHKNPAGWLLGHNMGKHKKRGKKAS